MIVGRLRRQFAFARHIPLAQIAHRVRLAVLRRWETARQAIPDIPAISPLAAPPHPVFSPRPAEVSRDPEGWTFRFLGRGLRMGPAIDWLHADDRPETQLWRMNLHYMEYLESLPDADFTAVVEQWIAGNPPYLRGAHEAGWNAYALSLRTMVWMQQLAVRPQLDPRLRSLMIRSLGQQVAWLERHLERDIGGNHLLKNIKTLLWASSFFEGTDADRWRKLGLRLLRAEMARQFLPDGMQYERSPSYHCQVFADLLEIRRALGNDPLGGLLDQTIRKAAEVVADLVHPDGFVAQFGDAGLTMAYPPAQCLDACHEQLDLAPTARSRFAFRNAGYYGGRCDGEVVVVDAGMLGPDSLPGHAHGDMLAFEWSFGGERVFVDQGVYEYVAGQRRAASRASANHNTVSVEGLDQADFFGAFRMGARGRLKVLEYRSTSDGFVLEAEHDGFARAGGPVHRRRFEWAPGRLRIDDSLIGGDPGAACATFLLAPQVAAGVDAEGEIRLQFGASSMQGRSSHPVSIVPAVWWPDMGVERSTQRLVMAFPPQCREAWVEFTEIGKQQ